MDEYLLVKHLIELNEHANKDGILTLVDYVESNKWLENSIYRYCLNEIMLNEEEEFIEKIKYLKLNRNKEEQIIITGFELIREYNNTAYKIANILGAMMEHPMSAHELVTNT